MEIAAVDAGIRHPAHRLLFDYWRDKAPPGGLPGRQHVEPLDLTPVLPWLILYDVTDRPGGGRFQFRLVGTGIVQRYGRDMTGRNFAEAYQGDTLRSQIATFEAVVASGKPDLARRRLPVDDRSFLEYERLILPLAGDGRHVDKLIALMAFDDVTLPAPGDTPAPRC